MEAKAAKLNSAVAAGGKQFEKAAKSFERQFGAGSGTAANMSQVAGEMTSMAGALNDNGAGGYMATGLSGSAFSAAGMSPGAMAFAPVGGTSMTVNLDHPAYSDKATLGWAVGHESAHNFGMRHPAIGGVIPYAMGNPAQRALFGQLPSIDPAAALTNPDEIMLNAYGRAPQ